MKISNESIGHALLRVGLGLDFLAHGLSRIGQLPGFAETMKGMFAKSFLPEPLVVVTAYAIPPVELVVGLGIVLGLLLRPALIAGGIEMWILLFGSCLIQQWDMAAFQLIYLLLLSLLLATLQHDRLSIGAIRTRSGEH
jgi:thiosulfate dehydrogenase [quinone] large subunit